MQKWLCNIKQNLFKLDISDKQIYFLSEFIYILNWVVGVFMSKIVFATIVLLKINFFNNIYI